jgi:hypothetical protein
MSKARRKEEQPDGPAVVRGDHVQDRVLSPRAGAKAGWSRLTVYEKAFRLGQLQCKDAGDARVEEARALDRLAAARAFDEGWQVCNASFPGARGWDEVRSGGGTPGGFVDHQRDAKDFWRRVEQAMGTRDWQICRRVCGENCTVAETVQAISPGYKFSTLARFREALDALVEAMATARRRRA